MEKKAFFTNIEESIKHSDSARFIIVAEKNSYAIYDTEQGHTFNSWKRQMCECEEFNDASTIAILLNSNEHLGY